MPDDARSARPPARLHPDAAELATPCWPRWTAAARAMAPDLPGHGNAAARPGLVRRLHRLRARARRRAVRAVRLLDGRPDRAARRARARRPGRAAGARRRQPGHRRPGRARRSVASPTSALAERIEPIGVEAFADEWGAQPLFDGQPPQVAAAARADRLRNTPEGLAAALRGLGTGVDGAAVGPRSARSASR